MRTLIISMRTMVTMQCRSTLTFLCRTLSITAITILHTITTMATTLRVPARTLLTDTVPQTVQSIGSGIPSLCHGHNHPDHRPFRHDHHRPLDRVNMEWDRCITAMAIPPDITINMEWPRGHKLPSHRV